jgi:hypothetical protein
MRHHRALKRRYGRALSKPKNVFQAASRKISTQITKELNKGNPDYGTREVPMKIVEKYHRKVMALAESVRASRPADISWRYYDQDMAKIADYMADRHYQKYALGALRQAVQVVGGAAERMGVL